MLRYFRFVLLLVLFTSLCSSNTEFSCSPEGTQIAFMADVHLQDIYGEFQDSDYKGVLNPGNAKYVIARTMQAQIRSTRIFNENYFAFRAALDDVAKRNIKYVVLPGDFSDDGQVVNVRGLKNILDHYTSEYGIRFFATTGNHDPVRPFSQEAGKTDFLGEGGKSQPVMSKAGMYKSGNPEELPVIITRDIREMGYKGIISILDNCGFFPGKDDLYWETPFSSYTYDAFKYEEARRQSRLEYRNYNIPPFNTPVPDVSYLVEPIKDLWVLAIDANVYVPNRKAEFNPRSPDSYEGAGSGYNNVPGYKNHLTDWVKKVASEAKKRGKTLITFSHYPLIDFNDDASASLKKLLGERKMQLQRVPEENIAELFADAGIRLHFGAHMHINDTGIRKSQKGNTLINVQVPSLAAYIPAYKLLTIHTRQIVEIETIIIDTVPGFDQLFPVYEMEYDWLQKIHAEPIWDKTILSSKSYYEFTSHHLKELIRHRFLKSDWPSEFRDFFLNASGKDLLVFASGSPKNLPENITGFEYWNGFDMIFDFYRLRNADKLAIKDIGSKRIQQYQTLIDTFISSGKTQVLQNSKLQKDFYEFANCFDHFMKGAPADHFRINLNTGEITELHKEAYH